MPPASPSSDLVPIRRALISVSDKTGLVPLARALAGQGVAILSTGGTAAALSNAGVPVTTIESLTGFPEIMDGRVKTLHPKVHGALLGVRDDEHHIAAMREHGIEPIDLLVVNLYPFEQTIGRTDPPCTPDEAVENIDIGGPAMIRSAAKNHRFVTVLTDPSQYQAFLSEFVEKNGRTSLELRTRLAKAAFARTARYDAIIARWFGHRLGDALDAEAVIPLTLIDILRYGENPHQGGALYRDPRPALPAVRRPSIPDAQQLAGKKLSYNNILDAAAAVTLVHELTHHDPSRAAAAIVKHTNPCGAATAPTLLEAADGALEGDLVAAYGGIIALNWIVTEATAKRLANPAFFFEVIAAPGFDAKAADVLKARSQNIRLLALGEGAFAHKPTPELVYRSIPGGALMQQRDVAIPDPATWSHSAGPAPTPELLRAAAVIVSISKALVSNAVAIGGPNPAGANVVRLFGAGAGQMDRLTACRLAVEKSGPLVRGAIAASDAFFPFPDGPRVLIDAGVKLIVHPGGSKRDGETFALCQEFGVTCMTTGLRHFRH